MAGPSNAMLHATGFDAVIPSRDALPAFAANRGRTLGSAVDYRVADPFVQRAAHSSKLCVYDLLHKKARHRIVKWAYDNRLLNVTIAFRVSASK
jgi:hypothetical protein